MQTQITLPYQQIEAFCQRHQVRWFALFGSVLRDDFGPDSDIDVLVEFASEQPRGLFALGAMQMELSELLGRAVDLKTAGFISPRIRQRVMQEAQPIYER